MRFFLFSLLLLPNWLLAQPGTVSEGQVEIQKLFIEANKEKVLGNFEKAIPLFEKVLSEDPSNAASAYELARIFDLKEESDKAIEMANKAIELDNQNTWYQVLLADFYQKKGQDKQAAEVYENLAKLNPSTDGYYFKWAYHLVRANETEKAIKVYEDLESTFGKNDEITRRKHSLYLGLGNYKKAEKELLGLIKAFPENISYQHLLAGFYDQIGEKTKAIEAYKNILKLDPKDAQANIAIAQTNQKDGGDQQRLNSLVTLFENPNIHIDVKITELFPYVSKVADTGDKELANTALKLAYILEDQHPNQAKSFSVTGDLLYYSGQKEEAKERYKKTLDLDQTVFLVWEQLLYIYAETGDFKSLVETSEDALDLFPNQGSLFYLNGLGYLEIGEYRNALSSLQQALVMSGKNPRLKFQIHSSMATAYHRNKQFDRSNRSFEEALKLNPNDPLVLNNYSLALAERGENLDKAKEMASLCNEISPNQFLFQDTYGWVLYKMKDFDGAKLWVEKAVQNGGENDTKVLEHLGDILFQKGEEENAISFWQKALDKGSKSSMLEKKIADRKLYE